jgi:hypothetical protein
MLQTGHSDFAYEPSSDLEQKLYLPGSQHGGVTPARTCYDFNRLANGLEKTV